MNVYEYKNRIGNVYYLQKMIGKNQKEKYVLAKQLKYEPVEKIPDGFEIYEVPTTGLVLLRKIQKKIFTVQEIAIFEKALKENKRVGNFRVEEKKQELIVYACEKKNAKSIFNVLPEVFRDRNPLINNDVIDAFQQFFNDNMNLEPLLKISIIDENPRNYTIERYYFSAKGNESPWLYIDSSTDLPKLANKYCKYIYTDKYYDFF